MADIFTTLTNLGYTSLKDIGDNWQTNAIYRQGDNPTALCIKKDTGEYYDFVEGKGGKFEDLILKTLNLPTGTNIKTVIPDFSVPTIIKHEVELKETKKFDKIYLLKLKKDNNYWNNRGISDLVLNKFQGGVGPIPGRMQNRYVFPIFEKDNIIGFAGRTINNNYIKWKLLGAKKEWLFPQVNLNDILNKKSVILIESIGDCISLLEVGVNNGLVLFGTAISSKIICFLLKCGVKKITILLNNDYNFAGNLAASKIQDKLKLHFDENQIKIITPPENDLNDMLMRGTLINFCKSEELFS